MSVTITESGLAFGDFDEANLFYAEQSNIYNSLGENIKSVEFVLWKRNDHIIFVEAKSSSPKPSNQVDFDEYIDEVYKKFYHSIDLFFSLIVNRLDARREMPLCFKQTNYAMARIKLIFVINGHKTEWLPPISEALTRKLRMQIKTWRLDLTVLNHELADNYGLLKH